MKLIAFLAALSIASIQALATEWRCPKDTISEWCPAEFAKHEAQLADRLLNQTYRNVLKEYGDSKDQETAKVAQRAWLQYFEAHCKSLRNNISSSAPSVFQESYQICRTQKILERVKELKNLCEKCR